MQRNKTTKQKLVDVDGISRIIRPCQEKEKTEEKQEIKKDHAETKTGAETEEPRHVCALDHKQEMYGLFVIVVTDGRGSRCSNIHFLVKEIKIRLPASRER